jgi:phosphoribosylanthranilate isomerase
MSVNPPLIVIPAIDIKNGKAVRLHQGKIEQESIYGDPVEQAYDFERTGARWLHVVDLDAAFGTGSNRDIVEAILQNVDISVEVSGGIRDTPSLERALATGAHRVILGTAAIENPEWSEEMIDRFGEKIVIGLDLKDGEVAVRGWTETGGGIDEILLRFNKAGCARYVITDISKDGTLAGPNLKLLSEITGATGAKVIASGGIGTLEDIAAIRSMVTAGVEGAIIGKALYEGAFTVAEAIEVAERI